MSWLRCGDTAADYPKVHACTVLADDLEPDVFLQMHGFMWCLFTNSSAWKSDYVVDLGTIARYGGRNVKQLLTAAVKAGLLTKVKGKVHGVDAYKLIDDPAYMHMRTKAEQEWEAQQRAETLDVRVAGPVRYRDGDTCRYCDTPVYWKGGNEKSNRRGTLDHRVDPDEDGTRPPATIDTLVVCCLKCNTTIGDTAVENRPPLKPERPPHLRFYTKTTATWLREKCGYTDVVATEDQAPEQAPRAASTDTALHSRQRPATAGTARPAASDPAPAGHRAAPGSQRPAQADTALPPDTGPPQDLHPGPLPELLPSGHPGDLKCAGSGRAGSGQVGSGRAGSGSGGASTPPSPASANARRRRSRSRRSRPNAPHGGDHDQRT